MALAAIARPYMKATRRSWIEPMIFAIIPRHNAEAGKPLDLGFLETIGDDRSSKVIVVGTDGTRDQPSGSAKQASTKQNRINAQDLMKDGVADFNLIQKYAHQTPVDEALVLDLTSLHLPVAFELLNTMRVVWIHMPKWHRALIIVCEQGDAVTLARHMANVFLITSQHLTNAEVKKKVRSVTRRASLLHLVGNGRIARAGYKLYQVYASIVSRLRKYP